MQSSRQAVRDKRTCLVVVAHPDDEVIWVGGAILKHPEWEWHIVTLCRASDPDRAPRFHRAAAEFGARAYMSDLDDSPELAALSPQLTEIKSRISSAVPREPDLIFTHGPAGEYTSHLRHEQVSRAVREMVESGELRGELVMFAYEDCGGTCRPRPSAGATVRVELFEDELAAKRRIVRDIYNFQPGSFEFEAAGGVEGFQLYTNGMTVVELQALLK